MAKKYAVVYSSATGNTKMLAEKIREMIPIDDLEYFGSSITVPLSEVVFLGFWTTRGDADEQTKKMVAQLENKSVFLFGTAGFGGGDTYFSELLAKVRAQLPLSSTYLGGFMCPGKMPAATCLKYRTALLNNPNNTNIMKMLNNFDKAATHPDQDDLIKLENIIQEII